MMEDKQQAQCMFDRFGTEIYEGEEYFVGNEGNVFVCDSENFDAEIGRASCRERV